MDSHRSFEFDRYPFDDVPRRSDPDGTEAYYAEDITHGMEIGEGLDVHHAEHSE
jgi:hypothetical protein